MPLNSASLKTAIMVPSDTTCTVSPAPPEKAVMGLVKATFEAYVPAASLKRDAVHLRTDRPECAR